MEIYEISNFKVNIEIIGKYQCRFYFGNTSIYNISRFLVKILNVEKYWKIFENCKNGK